MSRRERGINTKPQRARSRFNAAMGSGSVRTTRIIIKSPTAFVHRLKATKGKSDQRILAAQYRRKTRTGLFLLRNVLARAPLAKSTTKPATRSPAKICASRGLPSRYCSGESAGATPSHCETIRDALIDSQATGIQRAKDTRDLRSRSNRKSARMIEPKTAVAVLGDIHHLLEHATDGKGEVIGDLERCRKRPLRP